MVDTLRVSAVQTMNSAGLARLQVRRHKTTANDQQGLG